uniref:Choline/carnitine acyltransferase domain-containing protein n=1 Tax=Fundulus heteroclitus TaxID=8078 RepID=A0A3Q2U6F2_FUNHE
MLAFCSRAVVSKNRSSRYLSHQRGLPSLPVPPLQQTCQRYMAALEPIVEAHELSRTRRLVEEFQEAGGVGERLQRGLERRARGADNWVSCRLSWTSLLSWRLQVHSNMDLRLKKRLLQDMCPLTGCWLVLKHLFSDVILFNTVMAKSQRIFNVTLGL